MIQLTFRRFSLWLMALMLSMATMSVYAVDATNPLTYMKTVTNSLLTSLNKNKDRLSNHRVVSRIIYEKVVPHFDLGTMARSVLGRRYWNEATPSQRRVFIREFTDMIVNTYASAVEQYDGDTIKFHPLRSNYNKYRLISLSSHVIRPNGNKILLKYKMIRRGKQWRVYDFSIESISMVSSYRSQFSGVLHKSGVKGLIARLKAHNRKVNRG
jgi:phospholipid transport system substrate-binding protein